MNAWQKKKRQAALAALARFCGRATDARQRAIKGDPLAMLTLEVDRIATMGRIGRILHEPQYYDATAQAATVKAAEGEPVVVTIRGVTPEDWSQEVVDYVKRDI